MSSSRLKSLWFLIFCFATPVEASPQLVETSLHLDAFVNDQHLGVLVQCKLVEDRLWVLINDLDAIGFKTSKLKADDTWTDISILSSITWQIDAANQQLFLWAQDSVLQPKTINLKMSASESSGTASRSALKSEPTTNSSSFGWARLDYDLFAQTTEVHAESWQEVAGANLALFVDMGSGYLETSGFLLSTDRSANAIRLSSSYIYEDPMRLVRWIAGDSITGGLSWTRSIRTGGFQISKDFGLNPNLATMPLPDYFGSVSVPSTVDVFVGSSKVSSNHLGPGPFEIHNIPVLMGHGQATVVVEDQFGRQTEKTLTLYSSNRLLEKGLFSYNISFGAVRENYGLRSLDYGPIFLEGTAQYGLSESITVESHGEFSDELTNAGLGLGVAIQPIGVLSAAFAVSDNNSNGGALFHSTFEGQIERFTLSGTYTNTSLNYSDLADIGGHSRPSEEKRFSIGANLSNKSSISGTWIQQKFHDHNNIDIFGATYIRSFDNGVSLNVSALGDLETRKTAAYFYVSFQLGTRHTLSGSVRHRQGSSVSQARFKRPLRAEQDFGYSLEVEHGTDLDLVRADLHVRHSKGQIRGSVAHASSALRFEGAISGSVVVADRSLYLSPAMAGAFAVVDAGIKDVRVYRENREIARTNANGKALVTGLTPYSQNRLSVEPRDYPMSIELNDYKADIIPGRMSGGFVDLKPSAQSVVSFTALMRNGDPLKLGTILYNVESTERYIVGRRGRVFLALPDSNLTRKNILLTQRDELTCHFKLEIRDRKFSSPGRHYLGEIPCKSELINEGH